MITNDLFEAVAVLIVFTKFMDQIKRNLRFLLKSLELVILRKLLYAF